MAFVSTRGHSEKLAFADLITSGLAPDGGLYVPEHFPDNACADWRSLKGKSYVEVALAVFRPFLDASFSETQLLQVLEASYSAEVFENGKVAPLVKLKDGLYMMELFHGPTYAFKDVALQFLGRMLHAKLDATKQDVVILGATSGDTGSAAIRACMGSEHVKIFMLHPEGRVSEIQRRQMTCVQDANVFNIAVKGGFDDCQTLVKQAWNSEALQNVALTAVNSINLIRLLAQTVYYAYAACQLSEGNKLDFVVPTGNFGNVYSGHMARRLGFPIGKLHIATNMNDILPRLWQTGVLERADAHASHSPSMDIQVASNLERYLSELATSGEEISSLMKAFAADGRVKLPESWLGEMRRDFSADTVSDQDTLQAIKNCRAETGEIIDPHTAVGFEVARKLKTDNQLVLLSTAHPAKFGNAVEQSLGVPPHMPQALAALYDAPEKFVVMDADLSALTDTILSK